VSFVHANSAASLVGLRFGDQILQINGENVAGWDTDKAFKVLKKAAPERITMAVRDRSVQSLPYSSSNWLCMLWSFITSAEVFCYEKFTVNVTAIELCLLLMAFCLHLVHACTHSYMCDHTLIVGEHNVLQTTCRNFTKFTKLGTVRDQDKHIIFRCQRSRSQSLFW